MGWVAHDDSSDIFVASTQGGVAGSLIAMYEHIVDVYRQISRNDALGGRVVLCDGSQARDTKVHVTVGRLVKQNFVDAGSSNHNFQSSIFR